jgi:hypothetical protein
MQKRLVFSRDAKVSAVEPIEDIGYRRQRVDHLSSKVLEIVGIEYQARRYETRDYRKYESCEETAGTTRIELAEGEHAVLYFVLDESCNQEPANYEKDVHAYPTAAKRLEADMEEKNAENRHASQAVDIWTIFQRPTPLFHGRGNGRRASERIESKELGPVM